MPDVTILCFDVGISRIGVARCPRGTTIALPVKTVNAQISEYAWGEIKTLVCEYDPGVVLVGLPKLMSGKSGASAHMAKDFARKFSRLFPQIEIYLVDERLSSVAAHRQLKDAGIQTRKHRSHIDQVAAMGILESGLQAFSSTGKYGVCIRKESSL